MMDHKTEALLKVENLKMYFPVRKGFFSRVSNHVKAVDDVSFSVQRGETFGLVGESGCGKTTIGKCVLRVFDPTGGNIIFNGANIAYLSQWELKQYRRDLQLIFQDPYGSLDPRQSVFSSLKEALTAGGYNREMSSKDITK